ncbi:MAG: ribosome maturation factor RimP [Ruminococcaceae bacterium]|nr:ribosome maturation factor RimP [Oscillospiraceae bacterium]
MSEQQNKSFRAARRPSGSRSRVAETVRALITPTADELGYLLWDVEYVKEGADMILRVTIDRDANVSDEGITIDDCERMTRAIDPLLDEADPIEESYLLEVSSPGIERDLVRPEHFAACEGEEVELRLFAPVDGSKVWRGVLKGINEAGQIVIEVAGNDRAFDASAVSKTKTVFDF